MSDSDRSVVDFRDYSSRIDYFMASLRLPFSPNARFLHLIEMRGGEPDGPLTVDSVCNDCSIILSAPVNKVDDAVDFMQEIGVDPQEVGSVKSMSKLRRENYDISYKAVSRVLYTPFVIQEVLRAVSIELFRGPEGVCSMCGVKDNNANCSQMFSCPKII